MVVGDDYSKVLNASLLKLAFLHADVELVGVENLYNLSDNDAVCF
jgi:hypothetical protein